MSSIFQYDSQLVYENDVAYDAYAPSETPVFVPVLSHLSASVTLGGDGTFGFLVQDTEDEVAQSVEMIVGTNQGERTVVPTFGIPQQPFDGPNITEFTTAIGLWEPRARVAVTTTTSDTGIGSVNVAVSIQGTGNP